MDPKAQILRQDLVVGFDNCHVEYQFANELHKFRIEWGPAHWLYIARIFVDDHTTQELRDALARWKIIPALRGSSESRWLFLGTAGVRDVDDTFGRGY